MKMEGENPEEEEEEEDNGLTGVILYTENVFGDSNCLLVN